MGTRYDICLDSGKGCEILDLIGSNRQLRYVHGKSGNLDAEGALRSVLNAQANAVAKTKIKSSEMIRHVKVA